MKLCTFCYVALASSVVYARFVEYHETDQVLLHGALDASERFLVETAPGETQWITEEQKWALRRNGQNFMDITDTQELGSLSVSSSKKTKFPTKAYYHKEVAPLLKHLSKSNIRSTLEKFTSFYTRYYKSDYGKQSSAWLLEKVTTMIDDADAATQGVSARHFPHPWGQNSVIVTIPGKSNATIVIGAHQDSINLFLPSVLRAPGADDDGSGSMTILEALRVLLTSKDVIEGQAEQTIEFHWYSAEEGGLLGSQAIFSQYERDGRDIKAMLQQDMTGYVQKTLDSGEPEAFGIITDFVDPGLTDYVKVIIDEYCDITYALTKCGYACSDHSSASKAGFPSAFIIESEFALSNQHIHTTEDTIDYLSFDHMLQHAKLTLGLVYELAFADL